MVGTVRDFKRQNMSLDKNILALFLNGLHLIGFASNPERDFNVDKHL